MTVMVDCFFCGGQVVEGRAFRRVTGWERLRGQGGANQIVLREVVEGKFACVFCVDKLRRGVPVAQRGLF